MRAVLQLTLVYSRIHSNAHLPKVDQSHPYVLQSICMKISQRYPSNAQFSLTLVICFLLKLSPIRAAL